ncbi:MAG: ribosome maturation factor RimM [Lachnospiraceae bacterium]|nr:ribosome maturation factor RimM [Lachnospiraceae bacterium]
MDKNQKDDLLKVGIITSTHGIKGEVKVFPTTDDPGRFKKLKNVILRTNSGDIRLDIESVKFFKQFVILKFRQFANINDVEAFRRSELYVERENAVGLDKDEYFIADLIGMEAVSDDGSVKGKVVDVLSGNANDVYVVELEDGRELLLPAIKECIREVDVENDKISFTMMDGLL